MLWWYKLCLLRGLKRRKITSSPCLSALAVLPRYNNLLDNTRLHRSIYITLQILSVFTTAYFDHWRKQLGFLHTAYEVLMSNLLTQLFLLKKKKFKKHLWSKRQTRFSDKGREKELVMKTCILWLIFTFRKFQQFEALVELSGPACQKLCLPLLQCIQMLS